MLAIGGARDGDSGAYRHVQVVHPSLSRLPVEGQENAGAAAGDISGGAAQPDATAQSQVRLVIGVAADGVAQDENLGAETLIATPTMKADVHATATETPVPIPAPVSADAEAIDRFLGGSPLAGHGQVFVDAAVAHGLDPRLMPAVALWESSLGRAGCVLDTRNPFGLKDARNPGVTCRTFDTYADAIWAATATFGSYPVDIATGLCWWVSGPSGTCNYQYVGNVLATMEGIR